MGGPLGMGDGPGRVGSGSIMGRGSGSWRGLVDCREAEASILRFALRGGSGRLELRLGSTARTRCGMEIVARRGIRQESVGWSIGLSVVLIVLGILALVAPLAAGVAVNVIVAWLLVLAGLGHLVFGWHIRHAGGLVGQVLIGLAYVVMGIYLLEHPLVGLIAMTVVLGIYLLVKGVLELVGWSRLRGVVGGGWMLLDGVVSVILAGLIWWHVVGTATWVVGTLLGFAILFSGISRLMLAMAGRRSLAVI